MKYLATANMLKWWNDNREVVYVIGAIVGYSGLCFGLGAWIF